MPIQTLCFRFVFRNQIAKVPRDSKCITITESRSTPLPLTVREGRKLLLYECIFISYHLYIYSHHCCTYTRVHTHTHRYTVHLHVCTHIHTDIQYIYTCAHRHTVHLHVCTHIHTDIYVHLHTFSTYMQHRTSIHIHICTHPMRSIPAVMSNHRRYHMYMYTSCYQYIFAFLAGCQQVRTE